jgi:hypothetical protein
VIVLAGDVGGTNARLATHLEALVSEAREMVTSALGTEQ